MKVCEAEYDFKIDTSRPVIMRIDGAGFTQLSKRFQDKFDPLFARCMLDVGYVLQSGPFRPTAVYVTSDEVTLCWIVTTSAKTGITATQLDYSSRLSKYISHVPSIASVAFVTALHEHCRDNERLMSFIKTHPPIFDARVFHAPTNAKVMDMFLWRIKDYRRNSIAQLARKHFGKSELKKKNSNQMLAMLRLHVPPIDWNDLPDWAKFGTFFKRQAWLKPAEPENEADAASRYHTEDSIRHRTVHASFEVTAEATVENSPWLTAKILPEEETDDEFAPDAWYVYSKR